MTTDQPWELVGKRAHWRGAALSGAIGIAWIGLGVWRPTVTYHLAPVLVAGAWPWSLRSGALRAGIADARLAVLGATAMSLVMAGGLLLLDGMRGPTLWDSGHAMLEVGPAAVLGAAVGYRHSRCSPIG